MVQNCNDYLSVYMMPEIIKIMNKKCSKIILQHVLNKAPHRALKKFEIFGLGERVAPTRTADDAYLDSRLSEIYCDFLLSNDYTTLKKHRPVVLQRSYRLQTCMHYNKTAQGPRTFVIEGRLIEASKKLQEDKQNPQVYIDAEDLILSMTLEEACDQKQYLMFIYRWTLNHKTKLSISLTGHCESLKEAVAKKLSEAYATNPENQEIENELRRLQILARARQSSQSGNSEQAKLNYELVYKDFKNSQSTRMEALEYLCKDSQKNGDSNYLREIIINIIQQNGGEKHMKYVSRAISELDQADGSLHE